MAYIDWKKVKKAEQGSITWNTEVSWSEQDWPHVGVSRWNSIPTPSALCSRHSFPFDFCLTKEGLHDLRFPASILSFKLLLLKEMCT